MFYIRKETNYFDRRHISCSTTELKKIEKGALIKVIDKLNPTNSIIINHYQIKNKIFMYIDPISGKHLRWKKNTYNDFKDCDYFPVRYWILEF